jgi:hypothetical protein
LETGCAEAGAEAGAARADETKNDKKSRTANNDLRIGT